ncbi:CDP-alcohol phosphatidyltransferase family protein [Lacisediminihabitans sp. G11-30]|uniref:CDP-alcohol phosphatidyltransferase family protein n=2 Tax=Lacisediminihabitans changchengi TaxID=2787634 RepID=A0A934W4Q7_9MICO|nr:CDP-alcohol phosphatidyltransferase family protein [Lacisediminihabitans changchengi]
MSSRILTVPNVLSFLRLLMVPVFFVFIVVGNDLGALILLVISTITDFVDGQIARRFNQITRLGQLLDPAADRLLILAALLGLAIAQVLPWWFVIAVVSRDLLLIVLGIVLANHGYGPLPVHHLGKFATFCLFSSLPILMLGEAFPAVQGVTSPIGWAAALWGGFLYWWAGVLYLRETVRVVRIPAREPDTGSATLGL